MYLVWVDSNLSSSIGRRRFGVSRFTACCLSLVLWAWPRLAQFLVYLRRFSITSGFDVLDHVGNFGFIISELLQMIEIVIHVLHKLVKVRQIHQKRKLVNVLLAKGFSS